LVTYSSTHCRRRKQIALRVLTYSATIFCHECIFCDVKLAHVPRGKCHPCAPIVWPGSEGRHCGARTLCQCQPHREPGSTLNPTTPTTLTLWLHLPSHSFSLFQDHPLSRRLKMHSQNKGPLFFHQVVVWKREAHRGRGITCHPSCFGRESTPPDGGERKISCLCSNEQWNFKTLRSVDR
jgi:hypothetical protein